MAATILKIQSAVAQKPMYCKIDDTNVSIDAAIKSAIAAFKAAGKPLEAETLASLYESHQLFSGDKMVTKGSLLSELKSSNIVINDKSVTQLELNLVAQHSGGK